MENNDLKWTSPIPLAARSAALTGEWITNWTDTDPTKIRAIRYLPGVANWYFTIKKTKPDGAGSHFPYGFPILD